jgi:hypothetical protein
MRSTSPVDARASEPSGEPGLGSPGDPRQLQAGTIARCCTKAPDRFDRRPPRNRLLDRRAGERLPVSRGTR